MVFMGDESGFVGQLDGTTLSGVFEGDFRGDAWGKENGMTFLDRS